MQHLGLFAVLVVGRCVSDDVALDVASGAVPRELHPRRTQDLHLEPSRCLQTIRYDDRGYGDKNMK